MIKRISFFFFLFFVASVSFGQIKANNTGSVIGVVRDTVRHYVLRSANVTILNAKDSSLLGYQPTNAIGEFKLIDLPVGVSLKLRVSFVGYRPFEELFIIDEKLKLKKFGTLALDSNQNDLKEVVIKIEPVSMNNDTLEINTAGFKLDSNAVIEDVLRRTPGLVLWGDGSISLNGKDIKKVYVDGKAFFGGNPKIALQNLSKNSVQKVQIFNEQVIREFPDSSLVMNVKLKTDKKFGLFGKIGLGLGSNKRFDDEGNLNIYNKKLQVGVVATRNDVNKFASDAKMLLENSTFKGTDVTINYQSNFKIPGLNRIKSGGGFLNYNFLDNPTNTNKSNLTIDYFLDNRDITNVIESFSKFSIQTSDEFNSISKANTQSKKETHKLNGRYEYEGDGHTFSIDQGILKTTGNNHSQSETGAYHINNRPISSNLSNQANDYQNSAIDIGIRWRSKSKKNSFTNGLKANYFLKDDADNEQIINMVDFKSFENYKANRKVERRYSSRVNNMTHKMELDLPRMAVIAGHWEVGLKSMLDLVNLKDFDEVHDLDTLTGTEFVNDELTNRLKGNVFKNRILFTVNRTFSKILSNRYSRYFQLSINAGYNNIQQTSISSHTIQNIKREYGDFISSASINMKNHVFGVFSQQMSIEYKKQIDIPEISQLAPLSDSLNVYNIRLQNLRLTKAKTHSMNFTLQRSVLKSHNPLNFNINLNAALILNAFADSSFVDDAGRVSIYTVNVNKQSTFALNTGLSKAFKMKTHELQVKLNMNANIGFYPGYINNQYNVSKVTLLITKASLFYRYSNILGVDWGIGYNLSTSKQNAFNTFYKTTSYLTDFNIGYFLTKKLTVGTNINFSKNLSNTYESNRFIVLNAHLSYRFLKGNNAEMKISGLDLLHQNNNVFNFANANMIQSGTQNILKQYFIATISYYPRLFTKSKI